MQQAIMRSEVDNSESIYWEKNAEVYDEDGNSDKAANAAEGEKYFNQYIKPYIKYLSIDKANAEDKDIKTYELRVTMLDGSVMYWHHGACIDMIIDVNGDRNPNKSGYDRFTFLLCKEPQSKTHCGNNKHWCSYGPNIVKTRTDALAKCKTSPAYCSTLLQYDNWEFKDDYPYKI